MRDQKPCAQDVIAHLARRCAAADLPLRDARVLFDALYMADLRMVSGGDGARAAQISGLLRCSVFRKRRAAEIAMQGVAEWES